MRQALKRLPHVVWLDAAPEILFGRLRPDTRPLARDKARFVELYDERRPLYDEVATVEVCRTLVASAWPWWPRGCSGRWPHERRGRAWRRADGRRERAGGHAYDVLIGAGLLARLGERCGVPATQAVVVCDEHVAPLYLERVLGGLELAGRRASSVSSCRPASRPRTRTASDCSTSVCTTWASLATTRSWPSEAA